MNKPKCKAEDYIDFIVASQKVFSATEAARAQPPGTKAPAHDAFSHLLQRLEPDPEELWREAKDHACLNKGILVIDDSILDKPYAEKMELVAHHWSGKHHDTVKGICLVTLLWTDGERIIPVDYRIYHKTTDGLTKNDHFRAMLTTAKERGFTPECVAFDGWYASKENLKQVNEFGWTWLTRPKANRLISLEGTEESSVGKYPISAEGTVVHLKGYGKAKVFRIVAKDGDTEHWATNDLQMDENSRLKNAGMSWNIEVYHRGIKQFCGIERSQARTERTQKNHILLALRSFLRIEFNAFKAGISWFALKISIVRDATRAYIVNPKFQLIPTA